MSKRVLRSNIDCKNIWCKDFFCDYSLCITYICLLHTILFTIKKKNVAVEFCNILYKSNSKSKITFVKKKRGETKKMNYKKINFRDIS